MSSSGCATRTTTPASSSAFPSSPAKSGCRCTTAIEVQIDNHPETSQRRRVPLDRHAVFADQAAGESLETRPGMEHHGDHARWPAHHRHVERREGHRLQGRRSGAASASSISSRSVAAAQLRLHRPAESQRQRHRVLQGSGHQAAERSSGELSQCNHSEEFYETYSSRRAVLAGQASAAAGGCCSPRKPSSSKPQPMRALRSSSERSRPLRHDRNRHAGLRPAGAAQSRFPAWNASAPPILYDGRHTLAKEITGNPSLPDHAPLSGTARPQGHRLHRRRRARSLAQASGGRCLQRRQGHLLREADVAHRRRRLRHGGCGEEEQSHRADRLAAGQLRACAPRLASCIKAGAIGDVEMVELTLGRNDPTGAWEYPPPPDLSPQNSRLGHLAQRCARRFRSTRSTSRAGAAGRNTAPASAAI